jgi:upstream activation factor subunit UAF30
MAAEKKSGSAAKGKGARKTRTAQGGLAKPVQPDATLAAVVGSEPLTRAALTKKVWDYVKQNDLQDPGDKRTIRADAKLRPVFGGKEKVSMFEMTKLVNQHVDPA